MMKRRSAVARAFTMLTALFLPGLGWADPAVPIHRSTPLKREGKGLGTQGYEAVEAERPFRKKITEKEISLWPDVQLPKPPDMPDKEWEALQKEQAEQEKKRIPIKDYQLGKQVGEYVGWFGIVRGLEYDAKTDRSTLKLEHKYFDGLTDLHIHIVSIYGAGDFEVSVPGKIEPKDIPPLSLVCAYGKVGGDAAKPVVQAEYLRLWDWGLFTFMDYGSDKSNPEWIKLRKVEGADVYSPRPDKDFYAKILGERK